MSDELEQFSGTAPKPDEEPKAPKAKKGRKAKEPKEKVEKPKKEPRDNVKRVTEMTRISGVRKFIQIAIAKKAKSAGKTEAIARYEKEIESGKAKLDELLKSAGNDLNKLLELDEEPNKVITAFIKLKEDEFETTGVKVGKSILKEVPSDIPESFFNELSMDLHEDIVKRHEKNDYRLQAICKLFNFLTLVQEGQYVQLNGKWALATKPE